MSNSRFTYNLLIVLSFLAIYIIWGTTYLAIVIGLQGLPPFMMATTRFIIAGAILLLYSLFAGEKFPSYQAMFKNATLALLLFVGGQGLLIWSEQHINSGFASILVATIPIWFVLMDKKHWTLYFSNKYIIIGIIFGFIGILILFGDTWEKPFASQSRQQIAATFLVILGAMCWVAGSLFQRTRPAKGSIYTNLGWQLTFGALFCLVISGISGEFPVTHFDLVPLNAWLAIFYLSIASSILALIAYIWLMTQKTSAVVGTYAYINPIIAILFGWIFANETITSYQLTGMLVILVSAVLININRRQVLSE